jgi:hypothetical protein
MIDFDLRPAHTSNKYVYFSNGTHMTHDEWNTYKTTARKEHSKVFEQINKSSQKIDVAQHVQNVNAYLSAWKVATRGTFGATNPTKTGAEVIDEVANNIAKAVKPKKKGGPNPCIALRYIILKNNNDKYKWYFGNEYCSHKDLRNEVDEIKDFDGYWTCGGGFYAFQAANSLINLNKEFNGQKEYIFHEPIVYLFGMSDTYSMARETFDNALSVFPFAGRYEFRVMWENFEFAIIDNPNPDDK